MTYEELTTRWVKKTGMVPTKLVGYGIQADTIVDMKMAISEVPIGDFVLALHDHLHIPHWRRHYDWDLVKRMMVEILNRWTVEFPTSLTSEIAERLASNEIGKLRAVK